MLSLNSSLLLLLLLLLVQLLQLQILPAAAASGEKLDSKRLQMHEVDEADGKHDPSFDQEMLLGSEEASEFSGLKRDAAIQRLGKLFDEQMDSNKDGRLMKEELIAWLGKVADRQLQLEIDSQWKGYSTADGKLQWSAYAISELPKSLSSKLTQELKQQLLTAALPKADTATDSKEDKLALSSFITELTRKRRRWEKVDADKDGQLTRDEFKHFAFPEEFAESRPLLVDEDLERLDKDQDGKLSLAEFIADMWNPTEGNEEKEPEWVEHERKDFKDKKDKNKDGFLDRAELEASMQDQEGGENLYRKEADHLLKEADKDKDGSLSRKEILDSLDLLAGSAATNFGDHLREEL